MMRLCTRIIDTAMAAAPPMRRTRGAAIAEATNILIASIESAAVAADDHLITVTCDCSSSP